MAAAFGKVVRRRGGSLYLEFGRYGRVYSHHGARFESEAHAQMVLASIRSLVAEGVPKAEAVERFLPQSHPRRRFDKHLALWLDRLRELERAGERSRSYVLEVERWLGDGAHAHIAAFWGKRSIYSADYPALVEWARWLEARDLGPKTRHNVMAAFHAALTYLRQVKLLGELAPFPWPRVREHAPRILSRQASDRVLAAIADDRRGFFLCCTRLLTRPSETARLRVADYTPPEGDEPGWLVFARTKNGRVKQLPTPPDLDAWIQAHVDLSPAARIANGPLFALPYCGRGRRARAGWGPTAWRREWRLACAAAGSPGVRFYEGTKHTGAVDLLKRTRDPRIVQAVAGHSDPRSTRRYTPLADGAVVEAIRGGDETENAARRHGRMISAESSGSTGPQRPSEAADVASSRAVCAARERDHRRARW